MHTSHCTKANKLKNESSCQGIVMSFEKPVDLEDGRVVSQSLIFPELEFRLLLY